jgi:hypothetical protein
MSRERVSRAGDFEPHVAPLHYRFLKFSILLGNSGAIPLYSDPAFAMMASAAGIASKGTDEEQG